MTNISRAILTIRNGSSIPRDTTRRSRSWRRLTRISWRRSEPRSNQRTRRSLPDDLHQRPFLPAAIELAVKNLLPGTEVQPPLGHGHHHLASHDLAFHVGVGVVLAGTVVQILRDGLVGRQGFQPLVVVLM